MNILQEKLIIEPVSTIPEALGAGKQGYYQHIAEFQETKLFKCRNGFLLLYIIKVKNSQSNIAERWKTHIKAGLGIDASATNKLYNNMQQTGVFSFTFELLEKCTKDKLNEKERFWIDMYASNQAGLNMTKGNR